MYWQVLAWLALHSAACMVNYRFDEEAMHGQATKLQNTLTWSMVAPQQPNGNVYMSTAMATGCNLGDFGAKFHGDGSHSLTFSMWDNPRHNMEGSAGFNFQVLPDHEHCKRSTLDWGGETTGVRCEVLNVRQDLGVPYEFTFAMVAQNESGASWEVLMDDVVLHRAIAVGRMFFVDAPIGLPSSQCRLLGRRVDPPTPGIAAYSHMQLFTRPRNFAAEASWSNLVASGPSAIFKAIGSDQECCVHDQEHNETSITCVPPLCASTEVRWRAGAFVTISPKSLADNPVCLKEDLIAPEGYDKIGDGGCSTAEHNYPHPLTTLHGVQSSSVCKAHCDNREDCAGFAYCAGSSCAGGCDLYSRSQRYVTTNHFPGVECFLNSSVRGQDAELDVSPPQHYYKVGDGSCATIDSSRPDPIATFHEMFSRQECEAECDKLDCTGYEHCGTSTCAGTCNIFAISVHVAADEPIIWSVEAPADLSTDSIHRMECYRARVPPTGTPPLRVVVGPPKGFNFNTNSPMSTDSSPPLHLIAVVIVVAIVGAAASTPAAALRGARSRLGEPGQTAETTGFLVAQAE